MKVFNASFTLHTEESTEVTDITKLVREAIQQYPVAAGIALINTLHTTCALFINEFQSALIDDLKGLVERLVPERSGYRHDDPRVSDCERGNAHSHLRAALLGRLRPTLPVVAGEWMTPEARDMAAATGVWAVLNGEVVSPTADV